MKMATQSQQPSRQRKSSSKDTAANVSQQTARLPLIGAYSNRSTDPWKDQRFVNMFPETTEVKALESTKILVQKRPGLEPLLSFGVGEGRGMCYFKGDLYAAFGDTIWRISEGSSSPLSLITMTTNTGPVGMTLGNSSIKGDYLFICDGIKGWLVNQEKVTSEIKNDSIAMVAVLAGGTGYPDGTWPATVSTVAGVTTKMVCNFVCLGGIVTRVDITNPGVGYTTTAPTVTFTKSPGTGATGLAYLNAFPSPHIPTPEFLDGYIVLPQRSDIYNSSLDYPDRWYSGEYLTAEMFPDQVVGLSRQNNQVIVFGESSTEFFYDAANVNGSPLSRNDAAIINIGCAFPYAVYQNENNCYFVGQSDSGGRAVWSIVGFQPKKISDEYIEKIIDAETDYLHVYGYGVRTMGHLFYVLNLPTLQRTFLFDTEEKLWHEWSYNENNDHKMFPVNRIADPLDGYVIMQGVSNGTIYRLNPDKYMDDDVLPILCDITTNKFDFNTYRRKFYANMKVVADKYSEGAVMIVIWSDDDYNTWSNPKIVHLDSDFPAFQRMGCSRRRAFRLVNAQDIPLRLECIEVDYSLGES
jgi:hypothetical protein